MVQLLANLAVNARLSYVRVPALNALFPNYRGSALEAFISTMHDYGLWVTADLYPRYACDYGTPRHPPSAADYPEPFLYTYCRDDDPAILVRGAKNAPRPAGTTPPGRRPAPTWAPGPTRRRRAATPSRRPTVGRRCPSSHRGR
ncbi:MCE-family Mce6F domain protein [Mycobacteroides abscessus MAB_030201_1075]|uniref:MCE-family Mce6F domain protein n=1 Tax=Mycobacteroides abscessus MAB_030201_1075 TaxID=1335410 RepID=A0A829PNU9_9MYCO|nr:MCE-family Mce6F domain protein [Mycobacteroides abscessus MAB_030201_1075]